MLIILSFIFFFFNDTATTETYTLSLHDALPIFVAGTRSEDGDHTDGLLLTTEPTFPGCHVWGRPVGGLAMSDDKGPDYKVLCVSMADPLYEHVDSLDQVPPHLPREIEHFFETYKLLEEKGVSVVGWRGRDHALALLREEREREDARL